MTVNTKQSKAQNEHELFKFLIYFFFFQTKRLLQFSTTAKKKKSKSKMTSKLQ